MATHIGLWKLLCKMCGFPERTGTFVKGSHNEESVSRRSICFGPPIFLKLPFRFSVYEL